MACACTLLIKLTELHPACLKHLSSVPGSVDLVVQLFGWVST